MNKYEYVTKTLYMTIIAQEVTQGKSRIAIWNAICAPAKKHWPLRVARKAK